MPAFIAAWRAGFWPCAAGEDLPENHLVDLARVDLRRFESALDRDCAQVVRGGRPKAPLKEPTGVRFALAMTISEAGMSVSLWSEMNEAR